MERRTKALPLLLAALILAPADPLVVPAAAQAFRQARVVPIPAALTVSPASLSAPAASALAPLAAPAAMAAASPAALPSAAAAAATSPLSRAAIAPPAASDAPRGDEAASGARLFDGASGRRSTPAISVDWSLLRRAPQVFRSAWTKPNRQDYTYLATKTFGINLAVRAGFAALAVSKGDLTLPRALFSTSWYQLQDAAFTVFGQTYMKFLDRMTGLVKIGRASIGDLAFTFVQLCGFEFLNRLVLGPAGHNPAVYTGHGLALMLTNVLQGMISGGSLAPSINKLHRAGFISDATRMHLYQLASLTMLFGLFATFGYQKVYTMLTTGTLIVSWGTYGALTLLRPEAAK